MKPLVERYLASLPSLHRVEAAVDRGVRPPAGVVERQVVKGVDPRSQVAIVFSGPFQNDPMHRLLLKTMSQMLGGNLQRTLREDLGGTYGVTVEPQFSKYPTQEYQISVGFSCDPARVDDLTAAAWKVIRDFVASGPVERSAGGRSQRARSRARNRLPGKRRLLNELTTRVEYGEDIADVFNPRPFYDQLTRPRPARCRARIPECAPLRAGHSSSRRKVARQTLETQHQRGPLSGAVRCSS